MVITSVSPARKMGRVGCSPWSIFGRHHPLPVNFRPASLALRELGRIERKLFILCVFQ